MMTESVENLIEIFDYLIFIKLFIEWLIFIISNYSYIQLELALLVATFAALSGAQFHSSQFRIQPDSMGFIPSLQQDSSEDQIPSATVNYRQQSYEYEEDEDETQQVTPTPNRRQQQTYLRPTYNTQPSNNNNNQKNKKLIEEELEVEEPDRLSLLLEKSTFNCEGRTG